MSTISELYAKYGEVSESHLYLDENDVDINIGLYHYKSNDIITQEALDVFEAIMKAYKSLTKSMVNMSTNITNHGSYISWKGRIIVFPNISLYRRKVVRVPADTTMFEMMGWLIQLHEQEYPDD